jgi:hypothetical protein
MPRFRLFGLLALALLSAASCTHQSAPSEVAPVAAQLSVERFLQAANDNDVDAMGRLFGTHDGPVMDTGGTFGCFFKKIGSWFGGTACTKKTDVEIRMETIASIIKHDDYQIVSEEPVPGRTTPARRVLVNLTIDGDKIPEAPFIVVQTTQGSWLVEQVPLEQALRH